MRTDALLGRPAGAGGCGRRCRAFLLYLGLDRTIDALLHHTLLVGRDYRDFIRTVTRGRHLRARSRPTSMLRPGPSRGWPRGRGLARSPAPRSNLRADVDWERDGDALRDASSPTSSARSAWRPGERSAPGAPDDAAGLRTRPRGVDGNAFAVEPTLWQSACFRHRTGVRGVSGMYHVAEARTRAPGFRVMLGAGVTAGLVVADAQGSGAGTA